MVYTVRQTKTFAAWHSGLRNLQARFAIARRIDRARAGNFGDSKALGSSLWEMRIDMGQGYRVYFIYRDGAVIVLLAGGDKSSQDADIRHARTMVKRLEHE
ncbi:type II toxin-antitoxin system RelE/ParE family toxin [Pseudomonas sp. NPDC090202]|uniref:type II toxin-antitoxin system RelE/ParE family toxin n=1 Tax=unclassified Pseudomonas TaxID=196821 RepID=UPI00380F669D